MDEDVEQNLTEIIESVDKTKAADFEIVFDPTLVRGMSYYTGPIFEIAMDEFGGSVGGGGRYRVESGFFVGFSADEESVAKRFARDVAARGDRRLAIRRDVFPFEQDGQRNRRSVSRLNRHLQKSFVVASV
jgi:ATP phosphoribosyltransferase regulatory subunit HisZ